MKFYTLSLSALFVFSVVASPLQPSPDIERRTNPDSRFAHCKKDSNGFYEVAPACSRCMTKCLASEGKIVFQYPPGSNMKPIAPDEEVVFSLCSASCTWGHDPDRSPCKPAGNTEWSSSSSSDEGKPRKEATLKQKPGEAAIMQQALREHGLFGKVEGGASNDNSGSKPGSDHSAGEGPSSRPLPGSPAGSPAGTPAGSHRGSHGGSQQDSPVGPARGSGSGGHTHSSSGRCRDCKDRSCHCVVS